MVRDKVIKKEDIFGTTSKYKASEAYEELDELWKQREVYANLAWACSEAVDLDGYFEEIKATGQLWAVAHKEIARIDSRADKLCDWLIDAGFDPVVNPFEEDA